MKAVQAICVFCALCLVVGLGVYSVEAGPTGMETITYERHNIGLEDCNEASVSHNYSVFSVWESEEGQDFTGDGDLDDVVLTYYDVVTGQATFTNVPIWSRPSIDGDLVSFVLDTTNTLGYYSIKDGIMNDTGITPVSRWQPRQVSEGLITYSVRERDLTGDQVLDEEICYYDTADQSAHCPDLKGHHSTINKGIIAYIDENVLKYYDIAAATAYDTGLAASQPVVDNGIIVYKDSSGMLSYYDIATAVSTVTPLREYYDWFGVSNGIIVILAYEGAYWGDLNGDGDSNDYELLVYYDINTGKLVNTQVQGCCGTDISNGIVVFDTYESDVNQDLNGDGDMNDCIQQYVNITPMVTIAQTRNNIGLVECDEASAGGDYSVFKVYEDEELQDFNHDGDMDDWLLGYYDVAKQKQIITDLFVVGRPSIDNDIIAYKNYGTGTIHYYEIRTRKDHDTNISASFNQPKSISNNKISYDVMTRDVDGNGTIDVEVCYYDIDTQTGTCPGLMGNKATISNDIIAYVHGGVIQYYDIATATTHDTGLTGNKPVIDNGVIAYDTGGYVAYFNIITNEQRITPMRDYFDWFGFSNGIIVILAHEGAYWGDLNGDGDSNDYELLVYYDIRTGKLVNAKVQGCCGTDISNGVVVFDTYEGDVNQDLNGDGDMRDCVQQYVIITEP